MADDEVVDHELVVIHALAGCAETVKENLIEVSKLTIKEPGRETRLWICGIKGKLGSCHLNSVTISRYLD